MKNSVERAGHEAQDALVFGVRTEMVGEAGARCACGNCYAGRPRDALRNTAIPV